MIKRNVKVGAIQHKALIPNASKRGSIFPSIINYISVGAGPDFISNVCYYIILQSY